MKILQLKTQLVSKSNPMGPPGYNSIQTSDMKIPKFNTLFYYYYYFIYIHFCNVIYIYNGPALTWENVDVDVCEEK